MVTIIATVIAKKGNMEKVKEAFKEVVATVKATEPGTLEYIPHTVKGSKFKNTIIFYEKYENEEAMKSHMVNLGKLAEKLTPLLEPGMDLKTCFEII